MCEIGKKFSNVNYYNKEMAKGMEDKLFFIDKLPKDKYMFIDFGCADGTMINALTSVFENEDNKYIGYDISETMINIAKTNYHGPVNADVCFTSDWNDVAMQVHIPSMYKKVLILSSVIHEVYSYGSGEDIATFWERVSENWDYVVIRDMCPSKDIWDVELSHEIHSKIIYNHSADYDNQLNEFEQKWGSVWLKQNALHFLLKYRWKINWKRELNENYFPINVEVLLDKMNAANYRLDFFERFRVPFLDKCIKEDIGIELDEYTHVKAIFSSRK